MSGTEPISPMPPAEPAGAPIDSGSTSGAAGSPMADLKTVPADLLRILRDPANGLATCRRSAQQSLVLGLAVGLGAAIVIPLIQFIIFKMQTEVSIGAGALFKRMLGGVVFLAAGAGAGMLGRRSFGKVASADWRDDIYLFGSPMLFLVAGTLLGGILNLIQGSFFVHLSMAVSAASLILASACYGCGLVSVGGVEARRAVWISPVVFAIAILAGGLLTFTYDAGSPASIGLGVQRLIEDSMRDAMQGLDR